MSRFLYVIAAVATVACQGGESAVVERKLEGTVALTTERTLLVDAVVEVIVEGNPRANEIAYTLEATLTASTAETASRAADMLAIGLDRPDGAVRMTLGVPSVGTIGGRLTITAPADLDLGVIERGSTVTVASMDGNIQVDSFSSVRVVDPKRTVSIGVASGNGIVESNLLQGSVAEVLVKSGDIQLIIPAQVSAQIAATPGPNGTVLVTHPALPRPQMGRPYSADVNGGLATVRLLAETGNVIISTR